MTLPKSPGVYSITHVSGKKYVGSSINIHERVISHKRLLKNNNHHNKPLQHAFNKYGLGSFVFELIELCDKESLVETEQKHLDIIKPEYNILKKAYSSLGLKHSEESKLKRRAYWDSKEFKERMASTRKGHKNTEEHRNKISKALKGKKLSDATKKKLSDLAKERGVSPKALEAATIANKTRQRTPQELDALRRSAEARKGKPMKESHRQALVEAWKRRKQKANNP